jgi:FAD dependent oxidoreductase
LKARSHLNPSSPTESGDAYCTQGFTYPLAMEQTATAQPQQMPSFYRQYEPYYGYDRDRDKARFEYVFTYQRIWSPRKGKAIKIDGLTINQPNPGDISMQNWIWGNDYRPGTSKDNLIYTRDQLEATGQLDSDSWMGGLRTDALRKAEELSLGFYYWLVAGKSIAASNIAAAAYRVHSFEWSVGAAAGTTAVFALEEGIFPYQLVDELGDREPQLETLRRRLQRNGNPIDFPALSAPFSWPYQPYPRQNGWQELR